MASVLQDGQQLCRYYGAEFAIVTPGVSSVERATELTQWLLEVMANQANVSDELIVPTGQLYIEALPGAHPLLETFKLEHRAFVGHGREAEAPGHSQVDEEAEPTLQS